VIERLLSCQIARLPPIEDRVGDIRREIAEADKALTVTSGVCPGDKSKVVKRPPAWDRA
jgi:hypothetical protein